MRWEQSKVCLWLGVLINLGTLFYFKYAGFVVYEFGQAMGISFDFPETMLLPLGISFYTFQQLGVLIDTYYTGRRDLSLKKYLLYVTFFPQLIAGPIVRYEELEPQFNQQKKKKEALDDLFKGVFIFSIGLFKKVMIADGVARYARALFDHEGSLSDVSFLEAWIGCLGYSFQLYFDFSAYSDMAIGLGLCFGYKLPINFNSPFCAQNISDFWKRWHISLSRWFMGYIYTPLYMKWKKAQFVHLAPVVLPLVVMTLVGVWHGAGYTFLVCGVFHGICLSFYQWIHSNRLGEIWRSIPFSAFLSWLLTFVSVIQSMVLFRAKDIDQALDIYRALWFGNGLGLPYRMQESLTPSLGDWVTPRYIWIIPQHAFLWILACFIICFCVPNSQSWIDMGGRKDRKNKFAWRLTPVYGCMSAILLALSMYGMTSESEFLYFQF
jgi:D-alanyl-lipoteichoic acid acyltransferase DltB (MBOAT superfamily)